MDKEAQHQADLQRIRGFRLIDDDFMNACLDDNIAGTELILRIILDKPDLSVKRVKTQQVMKNLLGRDIWLDIDAEDSSGTEYDIEIQRTDKGAGRKRARYHSSILDAHLLNPGDDFDGLPETYVIFITENDVIGDGMPLYRIERHIEETGKRFGDGEHILYVNGANRDSATELGRLMQDFFCTEPNAMHYKELANKVRYFKEDERGVKTMCKVIEDMREETREVTREETRVESAKNLLKLGKLTLEEISSVLLLPLDKVKELAALQTS